MAEANCPDCDDNINVAEDTVKGEILTCSSCGLELEVKQIDGDSIELQELVIVGEDWGE